MRFVKIPTILSPAPDLSCVVIRKRHRENRVTISIFKPQLIICLCFGWFVTFRCVCNVTIAPRIASTAANKLRWRNCSGKTYYKSHCTLRNSALVLFEVTANYLLYFDNSGFRHWFSKYRPFTGLCKISSKIPARPVKYWPSDNQGRSQTFWFGGATGGASFATRGAVSSLCLIALNNFNAVAWRHAENFGGAVAPLAPP